MALKSTILMKIIIQCPREEVAIRYVGVLGDERGVLQPKSKTSTAPCLKTKNRLFLGMATHRLVFFVFFFLYVVATVTSMAGMEIFGWTTFAVAGTFAWRFRDDLPPWRLILEVLPWRTLIGLVIVVAASIIINKDITPGLDMVHDIGHMRWVFLLAMTTFCWTVFPPKENGYKAYLLIVSIIAIYAIVEFFTGVDLFRKTQRAVQPILLNGVVIAHRSAGTFGSPMSYVYIAGQYLWLPVSVFLLAPKSQAKLRFYSLIGSILIAASVVTAYARGAWIALVITTLIIAAMVGKRWFRAFAFVTVLTISGAYTLSPVIHDRVLSLFDMSFTSNADRVNLWKANWAMFKDHPILGIGYSENEDHAGEYLQKLGLPTTFTGHAHNNFLQFLSGTGIVGFSLFIFFSLYYLRLSLYLWRNIPQRFYLARSIALGTFGAQLFLHIGGLTECNFKDGETSHAFFMTLGLLGGLEILNRSGRLDEVGLDIESPRQFQMRR
jgi:O-antigen ligase